MVHSRDADLKELLFFWVKRHPFINISIGIHIVFIYLIYTFGSYNIEQEKRVNAQRDIQYSLQKLHQNQQQDIQRRIDNLERIKKLMDESIDPQDNDYENKKSILKEDYKDKISSATSLKTLLEQAKDLSNSIQNLENNIRADDLARMLHVPKSDALKQIESEAHPTRNVPPKQISETDVEKVSQEIRRLEAEARQTLEKRKQQLDAKTDGVRVSRDESNHTINLTDSQKHAGNSSGDAKGRVQHGRDSNAEENANTESDDSTNVKEMAAFLSTKNDYVLESDHVAVDNEHIPLPSGVEKKGMGMIFGEGGNYAERVYLNSWYVIGPFAGYQGKALFSNPSYPPEDIIDLDAVYIGKDNRILKWNYFTSNTYPFIPPDRAVDSVYYGYGEISFNQESDAWLWFGADDDMQAWVNNQLVWRGGSAGKQSFFDAIYLTYHKNTYWKKWNLTEDKKLIHFKKGRNTILFKLSNGPNQDGIFASIILTPK